ncbi:MAG: hypothetical protein PHY92_00535 [Alphaproteobacteria bacterium]|nr:hypothetical protein [Alphaproteobacteria bacterium]
MLNTDILDILSSTQDRYHDLLWSLKSESDVTGFDSIKLSPPALQPVVTIDAEEGGFEAGRPEADVYSLPDGQLIRLRLKGDNTYDYKNATVFPKEHQAILAAKADPLRDPDESIVIKSSKEGPLGGRANEADVARLRDILEADSERSRRELKAAGLIP